MLSILRPLIAGVGLVGSSYLLPLSPPSSFFPQSWRASSFPPPPQQLPRISTFGRSRYLPCSKCCVSPDPSQSSCTAVVSPSWCCNVPENQEQLLLNTPPQQRRTIQMGSMVWPEADMRTGLNPALYTYKKTSSVLLYHAVCMTLFTSVIRDSFWFHDFWIQFCHAGKTLSLLVKQKGTPRIRAGFLCTTCLTVKQRAATGGNKSSYEIKVDWTYCLNAEQKCTCWRRDIFT